MLLPINRKALCFSILCCLLSQHAFQQTGSVSLQGARASQITFKIRGDHKESAGQSAEESSESAASNSAEHVSSTPSTLPLNSSGLEPVTVGDSKARPTSTYEKEYVRRVRASGGGKGDTTSPLEIVTAASEDVGKVCKTVSEHTGHSFIPRDAPLPRIYDCFIFVNELDMLEIRLHELQHVVDFFVIVEARVTFRGSPKPSVFAHHAEQFDEFRHQIIHIVLDELPGEDPWAREAFMRESLFTAGLHVPGFEARDGDLAMVSDLDELPRATTLRALKLCTGWDQGGTTSVVLDNRLSYYSFTNVRVTSKEAFDSIISVWDSSAPASSTQLRGGTLSQLRLPDAGWHCSWCLPELAMFRFKMQAYSHSEHDQPQFLDPHYIIDHVRRGIDLFDRSGLQYGFQEDVDLPAYVAAHVERFAYLLDRRGPTAGFRDFGSMWRMRGQWEHTST